MADRAKGDIAPSYFDVNDSELSSIDFTSSSLGARSGWSSTLSAYVNIICTLPHPAAVFWGSDLSLVHNVAWSVAMREEKSCGKKAGECFSKEGVRSLQSALSGMTVEIANKVLLKDTIQHDPEAPLLLCPLLDDKGSRYGVLAQLIEQKRLVNPSDARVNQDNEDERAHADTEARSDEKNDSDQLTEIRFPPSSDGAGETTVKLKENRWFRRFAQMLPTGLAILDNKAEALFVNDNFYKLTTRTSSKTFRAWPESIHPEDYKKIMTAYQDAIEANKELHVEFRCAEADSNGRGTVPWRVLLMRPLDDEPHKSGFLCAVIDVSEIKAAEVAQRDIATEAQARRKQQESFIDMVSHEIRNPLSAIFGSAGEIADTVAVLRAKQNETNAEELDRIHEASDTILLCAQHQNSLVDDILSFSKLSADMLTLAPQPVQLSVGFANGCRLFTSEMKKKNIEFGYVLDQSYRDLEVDFVMADEHRLRQIHVNLMSNAIKFIARKDGKRKISLALGASREKPSSYPPNVVFFEQDGEPARFDATNTEEWGDGEPIYFVVAVKDTGIGMSDEEQRELFKKFRQATPRTQEKYGGSGLGLFISRKLCQLHGGEIGVASQYGKGSTFGFYFRAKRTSKPATSQPTTPGLAPHNGIHSMAERPGPTDEADGTEPRTEKHPEAYFDISHERFEQTARNAMAAEGTRGSLDLATPDGESAPPKIFLVEDNEINARVLARQLKRKGFSIMTAHNGQEAIGMFKRISADIATDQKRRNEDRDKDKDKDKENAIPADSADSSRPLPAAFDCILMDQEMPIKDGVTATREIRELNAHIPILGVSANARLEQIQAMRDAGMNDVVSKPLKVDEVISKIRHLMKEAQH